MRQLSIRYVFCCLLTALCAAPLASARTGTAAPNTTAGRAQGLVLYDDPGFGLFVQVGRETVRVTGAKGGPFRPGARRRRHRHRGTARGAPDLEQRARHARRLRTAASGAGHHHLDAGHRLQSTDDSVSFVGVIQEVVPSPTGLDSAGGRRRGNGHR